MEKTISISAPDGGSATIDSKLFTAYLQEAFEMLEKIEETGKDFKEWVETVAETTKLDKKYVSKYAKARYKDSTKETTELGELFSSLDEALQ